MSPRKPRAKKARKKLWEGWAVVRTDPAWIGGHLASSKAQAEWVCSERVMPTMWRIIRVREVGR
jgi:hypothetical protein